MIIIIIRIIVIITRIALLLFFPTKIFFSRVYNSVGGAYNCKNNSGDNDCNNYKNQNNNDKDVNSPMYFCMK